MAKIRACHHDPHSVVGRHARDFPSRELANLSREIGPCVYFIRTDDDLIKIGFTQDLKRRRACFGRGWSRVLMVRQGTYEGEQALHKMLAPHRARGKEYYHPAPEVIDLINAERAALNVSPIEW